MAENRNIILAIVLSVVILFGFDYLYGFLYPRPPAERSPPEEQVIGAPPAPTEDGLPAIAPSVPTAAAPTAPPAAAVERPAPAGEALRQRALTEVPRLRIDAPLLHGSISLVGARFDDLTLASYRQTLDPGSPEIVLLSPQQTADAYFVEAGWDDGGAGIKVPRADAEWTADAEILTPATPVTLTWDNGEGLLFKRTIAVDDRYMFTITDSVENKGDAPVTLFPYSLISRRGTPPTLGFFILHEGPLGVVNGTLKEIDYDDVQSAASGTIVETSKGGWIGITDKYWLTALVPDQSATSRMRFVHHRVSRTDIYQTDFIADGIAIAGGAEVQWQSRLFAGAKVARMLDDYRERYAIPLFDRAVDFGWFWFLTKPIFYFLVYIRDYVGNFGVAILILTVAIKLVFFPLANKSYKAMTQIRRLQPEMLKLRERFADDKVRLNQEMMALYKREKVNPASGCLPMLVQIPVFFALYKVLFVTIEMRHAPFFGWIQDLSARDPTSIFNLFGLIPWQPPELLMIGIWPLIMGATMYFQQKLNPQPPDPLQAKIFMMLPVVFTIMLAQFPAGLVVYWTWNNVLSIAQQWVIMRRAGVSIT